MSKKNKKRILLLFFTSVLALSTLLFSGCLQACAALLNKIPHGEEMTEGDFVYCYTNVIGSTVSGFPSDGDSVIILNLSEEGKQKDVLIIPETIANRSVVQIGKTYYIEAEHYYSISKGTEVMYKRSNYTYLYLPASLQYVDKHSDLRHAFMIDEPSPELFNNCNQKIYYPKAIYEKYKEISENVCLATVEYYVDEELYWIFDKDESDEILIIEPPEPTKDGYVFNGWYTEPELLNKWDFENDKISIKAKNETTGEYEITSLYAGWTKE